MVPCHHVCAGAARHVRRAEWLRTFALLCCERMELPRIVASVRRAGL